MKEFLGAGARQWGFLVRGLQQFEPKLEALNIPFYMTYGKAEDNLPQLCDDLGAGLLICDYVPVREAQSWRTKVGCPAHLSHRGHGTIMRKAVLASMSAQALGMTVCILPYQSCCPFFSRPLVGYRTL